MHVIHPATYRPRSQRKHRHKAWWLLPVLVITAAAANYLRPLPVPTATVTIPGLGTTGTPIIVWPAGLQAAIGAPNYQVLATSGAQTPIATASIAKVITALCVLQKLPLAADENGPIYTISASDVSIYNNYAAENGSVVPVVLGEQLTERQALEALMIPSANNIADSLVRWVFGSQAEYKLYAAGFLTAHGLAQTTIGSDASGFDPSTTSTASDLTKLGLLALQSPALLGIAGQKSTILPVAGRVQNYDTILGVNGITGLKTGNSDADTGAFLFTASLPVGNKTVQATGAVLGASSLQSALLASTQLAASMQQSFEQITIARTGTTVGAIHTAWGESEPITTTAPLQLIRWKDTAFSETHTLQPTLQTGTIGSLQVNAPGTHARTNLQLQHTVPGPSFWWRLARH
ncbi:MAG TPA: hypothetical protein VLF69_03580 [Candidatus Saccharimonadales bacterium]|nr:hypothetical protein [Candidatus Saccharimonadales bacterium]